MVLEKTTKSDLPIQIVCFGFDCLVIDMNNMYISSFVLLPSEL